MRISDLIDDLVQFLPEWVVRHWPMNKWYHVAADWEHMLVRHRLGVDYIVENATGIRYQGSPRIQ